MVIAVARFVDRLNELIGKATAWAIVAAILVSAINAIVRKVLGTSSNAWLELQWYLFGATFMLGSAWALRANEHIRIDIVSNRLSKRARDWIDVFGHVFFLIPFAALMAWLSVPYFQLSFASGEVSSSAGGLIIWPAKALIALGFILLLLQALSELAKRLAIIAGALEDEGSPGGHGAPPAAPPAADR
ncbi:TRAP transporter small permease subunit [Zavarzinia compransoris]|uniref:TRAP transporter small permease protein n=1 Tax=Zavarzinia compransoris TaxID=1264899 RepID=A0A317E9Z9_9PROT|nr:TRAP transporter small permease subunit [Zavarzinia compransoris]PWR23947.1 hypothetical protein DKG75_05195 [Zavarzinia compransoris]TDP48194.1 TRAP-type mannitol/chloroaromatic compound transport system permease small subunit [Zavarzinia compransoris]